MLKNVLLLILLSVAAIFFQNQLNAVLHFIMRVHHDIAHGLGMIFSLDAAGEIVQSVLALLLIPVVIGVLVAVAHFFIKQEHFPHTLTVVWAAWAIILTAILSHKGYVTNHEIMTQKAKLQPSISEQHQMAGYAGKSAEMPE